MANQHLRIDLNGLRTSLQRSLQEIICLVAAGLNSSGVIDVEKLQLPTPVTHNFASFDVAYLDKAKNRYFEWLLTCGFRDAIESVSYFLEKTHEVLTLWELSEKDESGFRLARERLYNEYSPRIKKFHKLGLPDKLKHLTTEHSISIKDSAKEQILSINSARNCLVHRRGIVSDSDANMPDALLVKWLRMKLILRNEDGDCELVIGNVIKKESTIYMDFEEKQKTFLLKSPIVFTVDEFSELTWSLFLFAEDIVKSINIYGIEQGFILKELKGSAAQ